MQTITSLKKLKISLSGLIIFDDILQDEKINAYRMLLDTLTAPKLDCEGIYKQYQSFYKSILEVNWIQYLVNLLFYSQNEFTRQAVAKGIVGINPVILENVSRDLGIIQDLAQVTSQDIVVLATQRFEREMAKDEREIFLDGLWPGRWPLWEENFPPNVSKCLESSIKSAIEWLELMKDSFGTKFISEDRWENNVSLLSDYYQKTGCGIFAQYAAFKVSERGEGLEGIGNSDPIRINNLICQEREQAVVLRNTESFLQGYPANNIILYGNRGTGKSSLVKALLNEYVSRGLRLVQLKKNQISIFPKLVEELSEIPLKFIVFIDDLSFNDVEEDYKNLKSLLEGGVESRPANVLVYATSNRKHLVRESFADRLGDDVHAHDSVEEKLSLADRFGITVTFLSPDQETYLKMVEGIATQSGLTMDKDELRQRALKWVIMHNGRSGRTARQFIDYLLGESLF
jgi:hypothetical protein